MNNCFIEPYFQKVYWWKFSNVLSYIGDHSIEQERTYLPTSRATFLSSAGDWFYDFIEAFYPELTETIDESMIIKQPVYDIFLLLEKRFETHFVFSTDTLDATKAQLEAYHWCKKLFNVIEYTYKKYSKIIELYNSNYNDLMKQLQTTTESGSRYNDTPQQAEVNLSYEDNVYTTNLTKSKSVVNADSNTPIVKIEEIYRNYRNVLLEWLNEFESLFVEENNI